MRADRRGFGLIEIIIMLAVLAVIAAVTVPTMLRANRLQRVQQTWTILERTRLALYDVSAGNVAFRQRVGANAGRLSDLVTPIISTDDNSCGGNYGVPRVNNWQSWGPFGGFTIDPAVGLPTPIGVGNNQLLRFPSGGGGGSGSLVIEFDNVDVEDVLLLDEYADDANGLAAGVIQWNAPVGGLTTMGYVITIDGTC